MANIKSQIKRNRQNEKRREANKGVRSQLRTRVKSVLTEAENGEVSAETAGAAIKSIDKAAKKGVLHPNAAARRKSRLAKRIAAANN